MRQPALPCCNRCIYNFRLSKSVRSWHSCHDCGQLVKRERMWRWWREPFYQGEPFGNYWLCLTCAPTEKRAIQIATEQGYRTLVTRSLFRETKIQKTK